MYAKLVNGTIRSSPKKLKHNGHLIYNPKLDVLLEEGYLPVTRVDMPTDAPEGKHYESSWIQTDTEILQVWNLVEDPVYEHVPTIEERVDMMESAVEEMILTMMSEEG